MSEDCLASNRVENHWSKVNQGEISLSWTQPPELKLQAASGAGAGGLGPALEGDRRHVQPSVLTWAHLGNVGACRLGPGLVESCPSLEQH